MSRDFHKNHKTLLHNEFYLPGLGHGRDMIAGSSEMDAFNIIYYKNYDVKAEIW